MDQNSKEKDEKTEKSDKDKGADRLDLDKEMAYRLLRQVGDQFCDLLRQEKEALSEHIADGNFFFLISFIHSNNNFLQYYLNFSRLIMRSIKRKKNTKIV